MLAEYSDVTAHSNTIIYSYDLLGSEPELRKERENALRFLDAISSTASSTSKHQFMEKTVKELIVSRQGQLEQTTAQVSKFYEV